MSDFLEPASRSLRKVTDAVAALGLDYVPIAPAPVGVGIALLNGNAPIVISIGAGNAGWAYLTSGICRDINQNRLAALDACNEHSHNNPAFNFLLSDADAGWDVIVQQTFPVQLLTDVLPFFNMTLESIATIVGVAQSEFLTVVGGQPYHATESDIRRLLQRSVL